jgi:glycosyltransferase involved in cell wall biosynthesis
MEVALFFTRGVSLATWEEAGILERELALYRRLGERGVGVALVTYGRNGERRYRNRLPGFALHHNRWNLPEPVYAALASRLHGALLARAAVVKSNQVLGADVALAAARRHGKPLIARCGYLHSEFIEQAHGAGSPQARRAAALEEKVFSGAACVVVTADSMRRRVVERYAVGVERVRVVPNYVDTNAFRPRGDGRPRRVCFVGRLAEQKDPFLLIEAMRGLGAELLVVGEGHLKPALEAEARRLGIDARFLGVVAHEKLPDVLGGCAVFVLPSRYEGQPKSLIEAMACGVAVVGADSPGIRELIRNGETGLLCRPSEFRDAIASLLDDGPLRMRLGRSARRFAEENFDLARIVELEHAVLREVAARP